MSRQPPSTPTRPEHPPPYPMSPLNPNWTPSRQPDQPRQIQHHERQASQQSLRPDHANWPPLPPRPQQPQQRLSVSLSWARNSWLPQSRQTRSSYLLPAPAHARHHSRTGSQLQQQHVPGVRASRLPRLSRLSYSPAYGAEIEQVFNQTTVLPPRWSFYVPDFDYDIKDFENEAASDEKGLEDGEDRAEEIKVLKAFRVDFEPGDKRDPKNWSTAYRILVTGMFAFTTLATGIYSTSYSSGISQMVDEFEITNSSLPLLGISLYLVGLALGALIMAPLSETFGRRPMYIAGLLSFLALIPVAALAPNFYTVIAARFLGAVAGSVMLSNVGGSIVDITHPKYLPLAISVFSFGPLNGPVLGPLIGGFIVQGFGWRALNWVSLISTAVGAFFIMSIPETYRPTLLRKMSADKRKAEQDSRYWCDYDDTVPLFRRIRTAVSRPFVLSFSEPVLAFWNVYIGVIYGIVQLSYVAFPIVFQSERGWDVATSGLAFLGVFVGIALVLATEPLLRKLVNRQPINPDTGRPEPEAAVLLICIGAVLEPIGQLCFALTSLPVSIPYIFSILSGVPFGYGFGLVFIYGTNYISNVFGMYSTSASAGNLVFRSIVGAILVVFGKQMYAALTPRTAGIALGVVELVLLPIPFVFYKWGKKLRSRSKLIRTLEEQAKKVGK